MKIALVQQRASEDRRLNRERGLKAVRKAAKKGAKLVCFSEIGLEPFYPQEPATPETLSLAESVPGPTTEAFASLAKEFGVVIVLNLFEREGENTYDSSPVIDSDGSLLGTTRMLHITEYEYFYERGYYAPGDHDAAVYDTSAGKIGVAICYDRHFPEYMRALALRGAEIVVIPQAGAVGEWPEGMYEAEMRVASFQNGYFTALCNRVGKEPRLDFAGESFVCNPTGKVLARAGHGTEEILFCDIDLEEVACSTAQRLFFQDRRPELYRGWFV